MEGDASRQNFCGVEQGKGKFTEHFPHSSDADGQAAHRREGKTSVWEFWFEGFTEILHETRASCVVDRKIEVVGTSSHLGNGCTRFLFSLTLANGNEVVHDLGCQQAIAIHQVKHSFHKFGLCIGIITYRVCKLLLVESTLRYLKMSNQNSIKEGDPNESTPTKSLHELTPLRSVVAPLRCHLSSVCGGKDKKNSRYRQIFWRKNAKKIARTLSQRLCKRLTAVKRPCGLPITKHLCVQIIN